SLGLSNNEMKISAKIDDGLDNDLQPTQFGEIDSSFETHAGLYAFDYLDGTFYGIDFSYGEIFAFDADTGASTANISIPITAYGICTDGTYLYTSVWTASPPNGTIIKWDTSGTEISRIHIPIAAGLLGALAWDGNYLWAFQWAPNSLLRINPVNGLITKNITLSYIPHDMTYYDDKLWLCEYGFDRVSAYDANTGQLLYRYASPYHYDSGITNNGTHFMQSRYIDISDPFEIALWMLLLMVSLSI
ncbi:MAG: YncE family protein, partial [Candidatus Heimdallarchaeota archaeon]